MNNLKILVYSVLFIVILIQPALAAPEQNKNKHFDRAKFFEKLSKDLNLTNEQKAKIQTLEAEQKETVPNTINQLKQKYNALTEELIKEKYDNTTINKITEEILALENKISLNRINTKIKMRNILSAEQFKQLEENMHKMHKQKPNN